MTDLTGHRRDAQILHAGRDPDANHGIVNPPVYHCSTEVHRVMYPALSGDPGHASWRRPRRRSGCTWGWRMSTI